MKKTSPEVKNRSNKKAYATRVWNCRKDSPLQKALLDYQKNKNSINQLINTLLCEYFDVENTLKENIYLNKEREPREMKKLTDYEIEQRVNDIIYDVANDNNLDHGALGDCIDRFEINKHISAIKHDTETQDDREYYFNEIKKIIDSYATAFASFGDE